MTRSGYNLVAGLALICGAVVMIATNDRDATSAFVLIAGTIVGRGEQGAK